MYTVSLFDTFRNPRVIDTLVFALIGKPTFVFFVSAKILRAANRVGDVRVQGDSVVCTSQLLVLFAAFLWRSYSWAATAINKRVLEDWSISINQVIVIAL